MFFVALPDTQQACRLSQRGVVGQHEGTSCVTFAGPERSGSTWLFNAIRLMYEDAQEPLNSYWIHDLNQEKLIQRGQGEPCPAGS